MESNQPAEKEELRSVDKTFFKAFVNGAKLTTKQLEHVAKYLKVELDLLKAPPEVST